MFKLKISIILKKKLYEIVNYTGKSLLKSMKRELTERLSKSN